MQSEHATLYHGTTNAGWEVALKQSAVRPRDFQQMLDEVAEHYGLNADEIWNHPWMDFTRGARGLADQKVYVTTSEQAANSYAQARNEALEDMLRTVYRMTQMKENEEGETEDQYPSEKVPEYVDFKQQYYAAKDLSPVVLTLNVPISALGENAQKTLDAGYDLQGDYVVNEIPVDWVTDVQYAEEDPEAQDREWYSNEASLFDRDVPEVDTYWIIHPLMGVLPSEIHEPAVPGRLLHVKKVTDSGVDVVYPMFHEDEGYGGETIPLEQWQRYVADGSLEPVDQPRLFNARVAGLLPDPHPFNVGDTVKTLGVGGKVGVIEKFVELDQGVFAYLRFGDEGSWLPIDYLDTEATDEMFPEWMQPESGLLDLEKEEPESDEQMSIDDLPPTVGSEWLIPSVRRIIRIVKADERLVWWVYTEIEGPNENKRHHTAMDYWQSMLRGRWLVPMEKTAGLFDELKPERIDPNQRSLQLGETTKIYKGIGLGLVSDLDAEAALQFPQKEVESAIAYGLNTEWTEDWDAAFNWAMGRDYEGWALEPSGDPNDEPNTMGVIIEAEVPVDALVNPEESYGGDAYDEVWIDPNVELHLIEGVLLVTYEDGQEQFRKVRLDTRHVTSGLLDDLGKDEGDWGELSGDPQQMKLPDLPEVGSRWKIQEWPPGRIQKWPVIEVFGVYPSQLSGGFLIEYVFVDKKPDLKDENFLYPGFPNGDDARYLRSSDWEIKRKAGLLFPIKTSGLWDKDKDSEQQEMALPGSLWGIREEDGPGQIVKVEDNDGRIIHYVSTDGIFGRLSTRDWYELIRWGDIWPIEKTSGLWDREEEKDPNQPQLPGYPAIGSTWYRYTEWAGWTDYTHVRVKAIGYNTGQILVEMTRAGESSPTITAIPMEIWLKWEKSREIIQQTSATKETGLWDKEPEEVRDEFPQPRLDMMPDVGSKWLLDLSMGMSKPIVITSVRNPFEDWGSEGAEVHYRYLSSGSEAFMRAEHWIEAFENGRLTPMKEAGLWDTRPKSPEEMWLKEDRDHQPQLSGLPEEGSEWSWTPDGANGREYYIVVDSVIEDEIKISMPNNSGYSEMIFGSDWQEEFEDGHLTPLKMAKVASIEDVIDVTKTSENWVIGTLKENPEIEVQAEIYDDPSQYGIWGGRISKLFLYNRSDDQQLFAYDRGWDERNPQYDDLIRRIVDSVDQVWPDYPEGITERPPEDRTPKTASEFIVVEKGVGYPIAFSWIYDTRNDTFYLGDYEWRHNKLQGRAKLLDAPIDDLVFGVVARGRVEAKQWPGYEHREEAVSKLEAWLGAPKAAGLWDKIQEPEAEEPTEPMLDEHNYPKQKLLTFWFEFDPEVNSDYEDHDLSQEPDPVHRAVELLIEEGCTKPLRQRGQVSFRNLDNGTVGLLHDFTSEEEHDIWLLLVKQTFGKTNDLDLGDLKEIAERNKPDGGYGDTAWNPETKTVLWVPADWTSNEEAEAARAEFLEVPGVEEVEGDAEQSLPYKRENGDLVLEDETPVLEEPWVRVAATQDWGIEEDDELDFLEQNKWHYDVPKVGTRWVMDYLKGQGTTYTFIVTKVGGGKIWYHGELPHVVNDEQHWAEMDYADWDLLTMQKRIYAADEPHQLTISKSAGAEHEGAMVAIYVPKEMAEKLALDDGEPVDDLHITLAFFEDKGADRDDWDKMRQAVDKAVSGHPVLTGEVSGYGVFHNDKPDEGTVLWAAPSVPGLAELRDDIAEAVEEAGFPLSKEHGWNAHITLLYGHKGDLPKNPPEDKFKLAEVTSVVADDRKAHKLGGKTAGLWDKQEFDPEAPIEEGDRVVFGDLRNANDPRFIGTVHRVEQGEGPGGGWAEVAWDSMGDPPPDAILEAVFYNDLTRVPPDTRPGLMPENPGQVPYWFEGKTADVMAKRIPFYLYPDGSFDMGYPGDEHYNIGEQYTKGPMPGAGAYHAEPLASHDQFQGHIIFSSEYGEMEAWPIDRENYEPDWLTEEMKERVREVARQRWQNKTSAGLFDKEPEIDQSQMEIVAPGTKYLMVYRTYFTEDDIEDGDYGGDSSKDEERIDLDDDPDEYFIDRAVEVLEDLGLSERDGGECFYDPDGSYINDYSSGERIATSACVHGFTSQELAELHSKLDEVWKPHRWGKSSGLLDDYQHKGHQFEVGDHVVTWYNENATGVIKGLGDNPLPTWGITGPWANVNWTNYPGIEPVALEDLKPWDPNAGTQNTIPTGPWGSKGWDSLGGLFDKYLEEKPQVDYQQQMDWAPSVGSRWILHGMHEGHEIVIIHVSPHAVDYIFPDHDDETNYVDRVGWSRLVENKLVRPKTAGLLDKEEDDGPYQFEVGDRVIHRAWAEGEWFQEKPLIGTIKEKSVIPEGESDWVTYLIDWDGRGASWFPEKDNQLLPADDQQLQMKTTGLFDTYDPHPEPSQWLPGGQQEVPLDWSPERQGVPHSFDDAFSLMWSNDGSRMVDRKKIDNNTYLEFLSENEIGLLLHQTYVVRWKPDRIRLDSGGWNTATTMDRINRYIPGHLITLGGTYSLRTPDPQGYWAYVPPASSPYDESYAWERARGSEAVEFFDGLEIDYQGNPLNASRESKVSAKSRRTISLDGQWKIGDRFVYVGQFEDLHGETGTIEGFRAHTEGDAAYIRWDHRGQDGLVALNEIEPEEHQRQLFSDVNRFLEAQQVDYTQALQELQQGLKQTHWMWHIFPQIVGISMSERGQAYGIRGREEAEQYLADPVLGSRLRECVEALLSHDKSAEEMLGRIDAQKLQSSLTLFEAVSSDPLFGEALDRFFAGQRDPTTLELLNEPNVSTVSSEQSRTFRKGNRVIKWDGSIGTILERAKKLILDQHPDMRSAKEAGMTGHELTRGNVRVEWDDSGESLLGGDVDDYDEEDLENQAVLRFYISRRDPRSPTGWGEIEDASYATAFPASAPMEQRQRALEYIMDRVYEPVEQGQSIKRLAEELSWIDPSWIGETPPLF